MQPENKLKDPASIKTFMKKQICWNKNQNQNLRRIYLADIVRTLIMSLKIAEIKKRKAQANNTATNISSNLRYAREVTLATEIYSNAEEKPIQ